MAVIHGFLVSNWDSRRLRVWIIRRAQTEKNADPFGSASGWIFEVRSLLVLFLFAFFNFRDYLVGNVLRTWRVMRELHGELTTT